MDALMEATGSPHSLKGLVAAAPSLGLRAIAVHAPPEGLSAELARSGPLLLSFETGFGALLAIHDAEYTVADDSGSRVMSFDALSAGYRGVVVRFESSPETATLERGRLLHVISERLGRFALGEGVFDDRPIHRVAFALAALLFLASALRSSEARASLLAVWVLSLFGGWASLGAARMRELGSSRLSAWLCGKEGCGTVLQSGLAAGVGLDLAAAGTAFFFAQLATSAAWPRDGLDIVRIAFWVASPFALLLIALQAYPLRSWCGLCLVADGCLVIGAVVGGFGPLSLPDSMVSVAWVFVFVSTYTVLVPLERARVRARREGSRLARILESPEGQIADALSAGEVELPVTPAWVISAPGAPLRLDLFLHPDCRACHGLLGPLRALLIEVHTQVEVRVFLPAREGDEVELARLRAVGRVGRSAGADAGFEALAAAPPRNPGQLASWAARWGVDLQDGGDGFDVRPIADDGFSTPSTYVSRPDGLAVRLDVPFRHLRALVTKHRALLVDRLPRPGEKSVR